MLKVLVPALAVVAAALPAAAQQGKAPPKQQPAGEILLVNPPAGWKPEVLQRNEKGSVTRLLPPGQTDKDWTEMITVQIQTGKDGTPRGYIDGVVNFSRANCEASGTGAVNETMVNGYPYAVTSVVCTKGKASGKGSVVVIHAVRGAEALYVVQRQWRGPAFDKSQPPPMPKEVAEQWRAFSVGLCDTRDPKHPCPE
ncbi:MAG: hypothetical protein AB1918_12265 [Pseudomonadota bacterium]